MTLTMKPIRPTTTNPRPVSLATLLNSFCRGQAGRGGGLGVSAGAAAGLSVEGELTCLGSRAKEHGAAAARSAMQPIQQ